MRFLIRLAAIAATAQTAAVSRVRVIALEPTGPLLASARRLFGVDDASAFAAINATRALELARLPLYTRHLMRWGRHDHMQLYSGESLGCLLSHMAVWRGVAGNETIAVLEEDAVLDDTSRLRLDVLLDDLRETPWDLLMLESGHLGLGGRWARTGRLAATCSNWSTTHAGAACNWMGSRGYLITGRGARILLANARPFEVQVDALMGLVATYDPAFRMYWTRADVAHPTLLRSSRLWDGCLKCYVPVGGAPWVAGLLWVALAGLLWMRSRLRL